MNLLDLFVVLVLTIRPHFVELLFSASLSFLVSLTFVFDHLLLLPFAVDSHDPTVTLVSFVLFFHPQILCLFSLTSLSLELIHLPSSRPDFSAIVLKSLIIFPKLSVSAHLK